MHKTRACLPKLGQALVLDPGLPPEQGVAQEVTPDPAPEPTPKDLPAPALEGKPRFYA